MESRCRLTCQEICHILKATRKEEFISQLTEYVTDYILLIMRVICHHQTVIITNVHNYYATRANRFELRTILGLPGFADGPRSL